MIYDDLKKSSLKSIIMVAIGYVVLIAGILGGHEKISLKKNKKIIRIRITTLFFFEKRIRITTLNKRKKLKNCDDNFISKNCDSQRRPWIHQCRESTQKSTQNRFPQSSMSWINAQFSSSLPIYRFNSSLFHLLYPYNSSNL